jgi:hypothetical protein
MEHVIISFNGIIINICYYLCTGIYNYVPEKNRVSTVYHIPTIL